MVFDNEMSGICHEGLALKGFWRLMGYGKLQQLGPQEAHARVIKVYLKELAGECGLSSGRVVGDYQVLDIPVGEIVRLPVGTVFLNGQVHSRSLYDYEKEAEAQLDLSENNIMVVDRYHKDESNELMIPYKGKSKSPDYGANNFYLAIGNHYFVPCVEVFRFFYATSSVLANALLAGDFLDPDQRLWNINSSKVNNNKALLVLRKNMLDADAPYLARFVWNEFSLAKAKEIYQKLLAFKGNDRYGDMLFAKPPIQGNVKLAFRSRPLSNGKLIITQLLKCYWAPNEYNELNWMRESGRDAVEGGDVLQSLPNRNSKPVPYPTSLKKLEALVPENPNLDLGKFHIKEMEVSERFPMIREIPSEKIIKNSKNNKHKKQQDIKRYVKEVINASVLPRNSNGSIIGAAYIESSINSLLNAAEILDSKNITGFRDNLAVLNHLKRIKSCRYADVEFILVTQPYKIVFEDVEYNVFANLSKFDNDWIYLDKAERRNKRSALIAKVTDEKRKVRYVIEVQQRKAGESATIVIWNENQRVIGNEILKAILKSMVQTKSTSIQASDVCKKRMRHTHSYNDNFQITKKFLDSIFK